MRHLPKVSIAIPTYNQARYVSKAIESVLAQDYQALEIVVSDDCSTDGTQQTVAGYLGDPRVRYYRNEQNVGRVGNYRKTLYERVTGEWALNLDGDDFLAGSDVISCLVAGLLHYQDDGVVAVVGKQLTRFKDYDITTPSEIERDGIFSGADIFLNWPTSPFGHLATLHNVSLDKELDFYRVNILSTDWESILRLVLHGKVVVVNKVIGVWRIHRGNESMTLNMKKHFDNFSFVESAYQHALECRLDRMLLARWRKAMVKRYVSALMTMIIVNKDRDAFLRLREYVRTNYPWAFRDAKNRLKLALFCCPWVFDLFRKTYHRYGRLFRGGSE